ncbi:MAG: efflux RND transporter periplasmic adaptor subunit [Anaerolineales bacterium]|nr:efflux RND transporter periplasmic adaptor subunit [Anaerolineales bacterium]
MKRKVLQSILVLVAAGLLSACGAIGATEQDGQITASGSISVNTYEVASEISGKVLEAFFTEGDSVQSGDLLFVMDRELLDAQAAQAEAAVSAAEATVDAAQAQLDSAKVQQLLAEQGARLQDPNNRSHTWVNIAPTDFDLPVWYFDRTEERLAAEAQVGEAEEALAFDAADLAQVLADASNDDFVAVEQRLVEARAHYSLADMTLDQVRLAQDRTELEDAAEKELNAAEADLVSAQQEYDRLLSTTAAEEVLEGRARVAVSQARLENARIVLDSFKTGEDSLQVQAALAAVRQAETAITQAEANLEQAQAALQLLQVQQAKLEVSAPVDGIVTARNIEVGEIAPAGTTVYVIGQLDEVTLTVYIPEDQYGQVCVGQEVEVRVDSFPEQVFSGTVDRISDEAEFTPRNVQTVEGRLTTVYAVEITLPNAYHELKPGMPADVTFLD